MRRGPFRYQGHRITYDEYGEGERVARARPRPADEPADVRAPGARDGRAREPRDHRRPARPRALGPAGRHALYSMTAFARPGRGADRPPRARRAGGRRHLARRQRRRSRWPSAIPSACGALFIEMPVLDNALVAAAMIFTPMLVGAALRQARAAGSARGHRAGSRASHYLVDIGLDWIRQDPRPRGRCSRASVRPHRAAAAPSAG